MQKKQSMNKNTFEPIAIIGVGALFPGSKEANGFWCDIVSGKDLMTDVPAGHWLIANYYDPNPQATDKVYCKRVLSSKTTLLIHRIWHSS